MADTPIPPTVNLANIQGNIFGGFNKDSQEFILFEMTDGAQARNWVGALAGEVATSFEVISWNAARHSIVERRNIASGEPTGLEATWVNVAFTHDGLKQLGASDADLAAFPAEFAQGMRARAAAIGDVDNNAPAQWPGGLGAATIHGVLVIASDDQDDLDEEVTRQIERMGNFAVLPIATWHGKARVDQPGHEHFGFKDGISQPGYRGVDDPNPNNPNQGQPGQDLLWPGEVVLGYPAQRPAPPVPPAPQPAPNPYGGTTPAGAPPLVSTPMDPEPGTVAVNGPSWATDGSFLVLRRLRQDVAGFKAFVAATATAEALSADITAAKLVGRYASGAPLELIASLPGVDPSAGDPSAANPAVLADANINNFEYSGDLDGSKVPRAAHIRKAYPRDEATTGGGEADSQTHRLLRRGIAYGDSFDPAAPAGTPGAADGDRGLIFACYQASIQRQFEFVQTNWVNNPDFPSPGDGQDPIISQNTAQRSFTQPGATQPHLQMMRWVTTFGGEYFFSPSITALTELASGTT